MIVRIMTEDQFRLDDSHLAEMQRLDAAMDQALDQNDTSAFQTALHAVIDFVRQKGTLVQHDEVVPSDIINPASDMSLEEARTRLYDSEHAATASAAQPAEIKSQSGS